MSPLGRHACSSQLKVIFCFSNYYDSSFFNILSASPQCKYMYGFICPHHSLKVKIFKRSFVINSNPWFKFLSQRPCVGNFGRVFLSWIFFSHDWVMLIMKGLETVSLISFFSIYGISLPFCQAEYMKKVFTDDDISISEFLTYRMVGQIHFNSL